MVRKAFERLGRPGAMAWSNGGGLTVPPGSPLTLSEAFLRTAAEHGDRGILHVKADRSTELQRYADLLIAARRVLSGLRARGLAPGDKVILQLGDLRDHFAAFWGCILGGLVPLTIAQPPTEDRSHAVVKKLVNAWQLLDRPLVMAQDRTRDRSPGSFGPPARAPSSGSRRSSRCGAAPWRPSSTRACPTSSCSFS